MHATREQRRYIGGMGRPTCRRRVETHPDVAPPRKLESDFGPPFLSGGGDMLGRGFDRMIAFRAVDRIEGKFTGTRRTQLDCSFFEQEFFKVCHGQGRSDCQNPPRVRSTKICPCHNESYRYDKLGIFGPSAVGERSAPISRPSQQESRPGAGSRTRKLRRSLP